MNPVGARAWDLILLRLDRKSNDFAIQSNDSGLHRYSIFGFEKPNKEFAEVELGGVMGWQEPEKFIFIKRIRWGSCARIDVPAGPSEKP